MARGAPLAWGALLGVPNVLAGAYVLGSDAAVPPKLGYLFVALGSLTLALGAYVRYRAPESLNMNEAEIFKPSQLSAYLMGAMSLVALAVTLYLLYWTRVPYVWPTLAFLAFVYTFVKGSVRYWQNTLTTYYVSHDRVVSEYRFLSLKRTSINHEDITNVSRKQSLVETLTGLGSVQVVVAGGDIVLRDLDEPAAAEKLLNAVRSGR